MNDFCRHCEAYDEALDILAKELLQTKNELRVVKEAFRQCSEQLIEYMSKDIDSQVSACVPSTQPDGYVE